MSRGYSPKLPRPSLSPHTESTALPCTAQVTLLSYASADGAETKERNDLTETEHFSDKQKCDM